MANTLLDFELNIPPYGSHPVMAMGNDKPFTWMETTMQQHYRLIWQKKNDLVIEKLKEKGFGHLIEGMDKRKFPKIMRVIKDGWDYVYADNDTDEGAFIVAIKEVLNDAFDNDPYTITYGFQWQDKVPIIEYKPMCDLYEPFKINNNG